MNDANLTAIMEREEVQKVERKAGRWLVVLMDGRCGVGGTVGEGLERAKLPDAFNARKAA